MNNPLSLILWYCTLRLKWHDVSYDVFTDFKLQIKQVNLSPNCSHTENTLIKPYSYLISSSFNKSFYSSHIMFLCFSSYTVHNKCLSNANAQTYITDDNNWSMYSKPKMLSWTLLFKQPQWFHFSIHTFIISILSLDAIWAI